MPIQSHSSTPYTLAQRRVQFDYAQSPLHWIPNQPFVSHFINAIHLLLPAGEFWFCRLYNEALPQVRDAKLRQDVQGFMKQEAMHARAHAGAVSEYLNAHKVETKAYTRPLDLLFERLLGGQPLGLRLPRFLQPIWLRFRLGVVAAVEHFTCVLGQYVLQNRNWEHLGADPVVLDLLRWHGAEEVEHRCVAFDLHRHLGGGYWVRFLLAPLLTFALPYLWLWGAAHLMRQDPVLRGYRPSPWRLWIWREWSRAAGDGLLPSFSWLLRQGLHYFNPAYHPGPQASTEQALDYLRRSPAALAAEKPA